MGITTPSYEDNLQASLHPSGPPVTREAAASPAPSAHRPAMILAGMIAVLLVVKFMYDRGEPV